MSTISAQISIYPLRRRSIGKVIEGAVNALRTYNVEVDVGSMSTDIVGDEIEVFSALHRAMVPNVRRNDGSGGESSPPRRGRRDIPLCRTWRGEEILMKKIGIIICDRWRRCAGGKCFRAAKNREGAFSRYREDEIEIAGYTTCDGCPGGNVEYAPAEMKKNGVEVIHLATGLLVGYPPCPFIDDFQRFIEEKYGMEVVLGTHPIPQNYHLTHQALGTWDSPVWGKRIRWTLTDEAMRKSYD